MKIFTNANEIVKATADMDPSEFYYWQNEQIELAMEEGGLWMNPQTGSVDTYDSWASETLDTGDLVEVEWDRLEEAFVEKD